MKHRINALLCMLALSFCAQASVVDISGNWQHTEKDAVISIDSSSGLAWIKSHADNSGAAGLNLIKEISSGTQPSRWVGQMYDGYQQRYVEVTLTQDKDILRITDSEGKVVLTLKRIVEL